MDDSQPDPEVALLARWRAGDANAGEQLYRGSQGRLRRFFGSKVPPQEVDEMVQQTWLALAQGPRAGGEAAQIRTRFRAYLFGVARHVVLHHYRRSHRREGFDPEVDSVETLLPSLSRQLSLQRKVKRLELALQSLPIELQLLAEARYVEELSGPELAEIFGIPEGTVRSRLHRARRLIDEALERLEQP